MGRQLRQTALATIAGVLAVTSFALAADASLQWKFKAGDEADYVIEKKQDRAIDLGGNQLEIGSGTTMDIHWKVDSVDDKGAATMTAKVMRLQTELNSPIAQFAYDSAGEEPEADAIWEEIGPRIKKFLESEFKLIVEPNGKVSKTEFTPEVVEALKAEYSNPQIGRFVGGQFDEKGLEKFVGEAFAHLPEGNPSVGSSWEETDSTAIPRLGEAVVKRSYKYAGKSEDGGKLEQIDLTAQIEFKAAEGADEEAAVELKEQEGKGRIDFDAAAGRTAKSEFVQKMKMDMSRDGQDVSIDSTETTRVRPGKSEPPAKTEEPKESDDASKEK